MVGTAPVGTALAHAGTDVRLSVPAHSLPVPMSYVAPSVLWGVGRVVGHPLETRVSGMVWSGAYIKV